MHLYTFAARGTYDAHKYVLIKMHHVSYAALKVRSDETPHRPNRPHRSQIFNILLTSNRTGATVCMYAMNSI